MRLQAHRFALRAILVSLIGLTVVACASSGGTSGTRAPRRDPSVMDTTDLRGANYSTVYDAISAQHADWLLPRGGPQTGRPPELGVVIDGQRRQRGVQYLRELRPVDVKQVRRLSSTEALNTYSWPWGGLVITLR
jgi:hypothetical protein